MDETGQKQVLLPYAEETIREMSKPGRKRAKYRLTEQDRELIVQESELGSSPGEIAKRHDLSPMQVERVVAESLLDPKSATRPEMQLYMASDLYDVVTMALDAILADPKVAFRGALEAGRPDRVMGVAKQAAELHRQIIEDARVRLGADTGGGGHSLESTLAQVAERVQNVRGVLARMRALDNATKDADPAEAQEVVSVPDERTEP